MMNRKHFVSRHAERRQSNNVSIFLKLDTISCNIRRSFWPRGKERGRGKEKASTPVETHSVNNNNNNNNNFINLYCANINPKKFHLRINLLNKILKS